MSQNTKQANQKSKMLLIGKKAFGFVIFCLVTICSYFLCKKDLYLFGLLLIYNTYMNLINKHIDEIRKDGYKDKPKDYHISIENMKKNLQPIYFDAIFCFVMAILMIMRAITIDTHILFNIYILLNGIIMVPLMITIILTSYEIMRIESSINTILSKQDILNLMKYTITLFKKGYHGVIILTKVLPQNISEQQKEELDQFFIKVLENVVYENLFTKEICIGQYSDDEFIVCFNNEENNYEEVFFKSLDLYNSTNSEKALELLTAFDHDKLKENGGRIVPYTYKCAYKLGGKITNLEQLFKKACKSPIIK